MWSEVFPTAQSSPGEVAVSLPPHTLVWVGLRLLSQDASARAHFPKALQGSALPTGLRASSFKALDSFLYVPLHETSTLTLTACPSFTKGHSAHQHSHLPPVLHPCSSLSLCPTPSTLRPTDYPSSLCSALKIPSSIQLCPHAATPSMPAVIVTDVSECLCVPISFFYHLILKTTM